MAAWIPPIHHLLIFSCVFASFWSSHHVWKDVLDDLTFQYTIMALILKGFVVQLWWQLFSSVCMTTKYCLKKNWIAISTFHEILKDFFVCMVIWTKTVKRKHFMVIWLKYGCSTSGIYSHKIHLVEAGEERCIWAAETKICMVNLRIGSSFLQGCNTSIMGSISLTPPWVLMKRNYTQWSSSWWRIRTILRRTQCQQVI